MNVCTVKSQHLWIVLGAKKYALLTLSSSSCLDTATVGKNWWRCQVKLVLISFWLLMGSPPEIFSPIFTCWNDPSIAVSVTQMWRNVVDPKEDGRKTTSNQHIKQNTTYRAKQTPSLSGIYLGYQLFPHPSRGGYNLNNNVKQKTYISDVSTSKTRTLFNQFIFCKGFMLTFLPRLGRVSKAATPDHRLARRATASTRSAPWSPT